MNVGVTGHQDLGGPGTEQWVVEAVAAVVDRVGVTNGFTCLAKGADQVYAQTLLARKIPFTVVMACRQIEASFDTAEDRQEFRRLCAEAAETLILPFEAPSEEAYYEAGKVVIDRSELIIAVWNGRPAQGLGGTGDIVKYALRKGIAVIHIDLESRTIHEPRVA